MTSGLEWVCPDCGKINSYTYIRYRKPRIKCKNEDCGHMFLLGVMVGEPSVVGIPPGNTRIVPRGKKPGMILNRKAPPKGGAGWARARGGIFWLCDDCGAWAYDHPDWDTGLVHCNVCRSVRGTGIIIYHAPTGKIVGSPWDWTPPRGFYVPNGKKCMAPQAAGEGAGESGGVASDAGEAAQEADGVA
jgi:hypothetical protein